MIRLFFAINLLAVNLSFAQPATVSLEGKDQSLNERYHLMKSKSQTFQDYKVIKEFVLDGFWKITMDTVKFQKGVIAQSKDKISELEASLQGSEMTLKKEREDAASIQHNSTHISVLGIDFAKSSFLTLASFLLAGLVAAIVFITGKMRLMATHLREKVMIADLISNEYDDFKRRALDKQMKLSRELQNERNKLEELKPSRN